MVTDSSGIRSRLVLPVLAYGALLVAALQIMVVPIVRDIGVSLGDSTSAVNWVVTANLLAAAVFTPLLGRLGDLRDRRPVLIGVLAVLGAALVLLLIPLSQGNRWAGVRPR
jgi:MFS family permease